jgi:hypothetical protein
VDSFLSRSRKEVIPLGGKSTKIGRDAGTGKFIPVKQAERHPKTSVVETVKKK